VAGLCKYGKSGNLCFQGAPTAPTGGHRDSFPPRLDDNGQLGPMTMSGGAILLKGNIDGPGLGIELDEDMINNECGIPEWQFPEMWDAVDGSVRDH
jgi:hypothetical protein